MGKPERIASAPSEAAYFRARAIDERRRGRQALSDRARGLHDELAGHYEALAGQLEHEATPASRSLTDTVRDMLERLTAR